MSIHWTIKRFKGHRSVTTVALNRRIELESKGGIAKLKPRSTVHCHFVRKPLKIVEKSNQLLVLGLFIYSDVNVIENKCSDRSMKV